MAKGDFHIHREVQIGLPATDFPQDIGFEHQCRHKQAFVAEKVFDEIFRIVRQGDVGLVGYFAVAVIVELVDDEIAIRMLFRVIGLGLDGVWVDPVVVIDELDVVAVREVEPAIAGQARLSVRKRFRDGCEIL